MIEQEFTEQAFDGSILYLRNIIGSYNIKARKRILLAAHWDTRPFAERMWKADMNQFLGQMMEQVELEFCWKWPEY